MRDLRPAFLVIGVMLIGLGAAMLAPMVADLRAASPDWRSFAQTAALCVFFGGAMAISARGSVTTLSIRAAFLMTSLSWVVITSLAAVPFLAARIGLSVGDAFFESMSGLTTTGATVITGLDTKPPGLLLWRAILQWIGGVGIIVTAIAILPILQVGGMQLFRIESSDTADKLLPRAGQLAGYIALVYLLLTIACATTYAALGMTPFEAVTHAMTTMSAGGYSTSDSSMSKFVGGGADIGAVVFMIAAALPFTIYVRAIRGKVRDAWRDGQARLFVALAAGLSLVMTAYLVGARDYALGGALRQAAFNIVSVLSGTGYATTDYGAWGPFAVAVFFCVTFLGGCAGSASCGIKMFRLQIGAVAMQRFLQDMIRPHRVTLMRYNGRPLSDEAVQSVLSFFFLYFATFAVSALLLASLGIDTTTALSAAATCLANVGPGLGDIVGPAGTFAPLPEAAKWILSVTMLLGRLEILAVLVLLSPGLWRS